MARNDCPALLRQLLGTDTDADAPPARGSGTDAGAAAAASASSPSPAPSSADLPSLLNSFSLRSNGFTPLHLAVCACIPSMVSSLLAAGADPCARSTKPLLGRDEGAIERGEYLYRSAKQLEEHPAPHMDSQKGRQQQQQPLSSWSLRYSDRLPIGGLLPELRSRETGFTPLMLAVIFSPDSTVLEVAGALLAHPAVRKDVNFATPHCGWSAGMLAAHRGNPALWSLLQEYGADVSAAAQGMHGDARTIAADLGGSQRADALAEEDARREACHQEVQRCLGDQANMAQDCVELCLSYAGWHTAHSRRDANAPAPYAWPPASPATLAQLTPAQGGI